jgi:hypothetical protein
VKIDFRVEGGLAAFPGLAAPVTIECDALPAPEKARIHELVQRAGFFALPARDARAAMPDTRAYTIAVDDGARCKTVTVREPIANPALRDLVDALRDKALAARRRR